MDYKDTVRQKRQASKQKKDDDFKQKQLLTTIVAGNSKVADKIKDKVTINNSDLAKSDDIKSVVETLQALSENLASNKISEATAQLAEVVGAVTLLSSEIPKFPEINIPDYPTELSVNNLTDIKPWLNSVVKSVKALKLDPTINVESPTVKVKENKIDLQPLLEKLDSVEQTFKSFEVPETDITSLVSASKATTKAINSLEFPVPNYVLPYIKDGKGTQVVLDSNGKVPVDATVNASVDLGAQDIGNSTADTQRVVLASDQPVVSIDDNDSSLTVDGTVTANLGATDNAVLDTIATNTTQRGSTSAVTSVADSATSVELLASNTDRLEATITNDSSADLYVKLGTTASTTSYTLKLGQNESYIIDKYTGKIDGIWASDPGDGAARITEVT